MMGWKGMGDYAGAAVAEKSIIGSLLDLIMGIPYTACIHGSTQCSIGVYTHLQNIGFGLELVV
jgi:hypothetical protein